MKKGMTRSFLGKTFFIPQYVHFEINSLNCDRIYDGKRPTDKQMHIHDSGKYVYFPNSQAAEYGTDYFIDKCLESNQPPLIPNEPEFWLKELYETPID